MRKKKSTKALRRSLWLKDPRCTYCLKKIRLDESSLDHIYPKSKGGTHRVDNLVLCCLKCNKDKDDMLMEEFLESISG